MTCTVPLDIPQGLYDRLLAICIEVDKKPEDIVKFLLERFVNENCGGKL